MNKRIRNQRGSSMMGALMIVMALGFMGMAAVELASSDQMASVHDHHSTLAQSYVTAGLEYARNRLDQGYDPTVTDKAFGIGSFSVYTIPESSTIVVTARVGDAQRSQSISANFASQVVDVNVDNAYTTGEDIRGIQLVKDGNSAVTVTNVQLTWNWDECVTDASCSTDYNDYLDSNGKLVFCHVPPGNPSAAQTHHGSIQSWENGHDSANHESQNHNMDYLGECGSTCVQNEISESDIENCEDSDGAAYISEIMFEGAVVYSDAGSVDPETQSVSCAVPEAEEDDDDHDGDDDHDDDDHDGDDEDDSHLLSPADSMLALLGIGDAKAGRSSSSDDHGSSDHGSSDHGSSSGSSSTSTSTSSATSTASTSSTSTSSSSSTGTGTSSDDDDDDGEDDDDDHADDYDDEVYDYVEEEEAAADTSGECGAYTVSSDDHYDYEDPDDDEDGHQEDDEDINIVNATMTTNGSYDFNYIRFSSEHPGGGHYEMRVEFSDGSSITKTWIDGVGAQGGSGQFEVDSGSVEVTANNTVQVDVLGSAITCGAGGPEVGVSVKLGVDGTYSTLFSGADVDGGESYSTTAAPEGTTYTIKATGSLSSCNHFNRTVGSTDTVNVRTLVNGDTAPALEGFGGQKPVQDFLEDYLDTEGRIVLDDNQIIMLFEIGVDARMNPSSTAADYQDLVVLFTLTQN